ncbi:MAG: signal peptidase II [Candidatus Moranbacteria bacterium]|nr:signal peptidase II [Candidatus Moranbacteria bacterium]
MVNAKNAKKIFRKNVWRFIRPLHTAWNSNKIKFGFITVILIILADQLVKYLVVQKNLPDWKVFSTVLYNPVLSLSLSFPPLVFGVGWFLAMLSLLFLIYKFKSWFLLLVLAGALSNLIDRLFLGGVVDYLSILNFPIFNLADSFISLGFLFFLLNLKNSLDFF